MRKETSTLKLGGYGPNLTRFSCEDDKDVTSAGRLIAFRIGSKIATALCGVGGSGETTEADRTIVQLARIAQALENIAEKMGKP